MLKAITLNNGLFGGFVADGSTASNPAVAVSARGIGHLYGDVIPVQGEVRMLAALEGITGVLYIAITVALLISAYRPRSSST